MSGVKTCENCAVSSVNCQDMTSHVISCIAKQNVYGPLKFQHISDYLRGILLTLQGSLRPHTGIIGGNLRGRTEELPDLKGFFQGAKLKCKPKVFLSVPQNIACDQWQVKEFFTKLKNIYRDNFIIVIINFFTSDLE